VDGSQLTNVPNELPSQTGNSGKYLTTNGTATSWATVTGGVTSITGTANEITVTGTTTPTLSLPSALTFTGKTVTGGTFNSGAFNGTVGATTPASVAGTTITGTSSLTLGANGGTGGSIQVFGSTSGSATIGASSTGVLTLPDHISGAINLQNAATAPTTGVSIGFSQTRFQIFYSSGFQARLDGGNLTASRIISFPDAAGTLALVSGNLGTPSAIVLTNATGTAAGLTAGNVTTIPALSGAITNTGNATVLGSFTMAQLSAAVSDGNPAYVGAANTFTGTTNTFTLPTTTGTTTTSGIAVAGNSLTTGTGIYAASSSLTSGKLLDLQVSGTAAAASQTALNVATAGANGTSGITSNGAVISNTHTGTTSTNVALELTASGGTTNVALNATAGHVLVPDGSYVYNTSVSPSIGRSAVAANSASQSGILLGSGSLTLLTSSIRGLIFNNTGAFGNYLMITPVAGSTTFSGTVVATSVFQAAENKTSTPNTGTLVGGSGSGTNIAGGALHIQGGASTGSAAGGSILIRTTPAGGSGSSANAAVTAITIDSTQAVTLAATLAVTGASTLTGLLTANGGITLGDAQNIAFNTTTGTKIGTATTQKLSFWNATPIVQPTTAIASATVASPGGGVNIKTDDTFDGYTIAQVVKALRNAGLLA